MDSNIPTSPEDRLLDELLHEQSQVPDATFLERLEVAVDAGPVNAAKRPASSSKTLVAIAAGLALAAGLAFWWRPFDRNPSAAQIEYSKALVAARKAQAATDLQQLNKAICEQEKKVEDRRKALASIAKNKAIIYNATDSFYGQSGVSKDQRRKLAVGAQPSLAIPDPKPMPDMAMSEGSLLSSSSLGAQAMSGGLGGSGTGKGFGRGSGSGMGNGSGKLFGLIPNNGERPAKRDRNWREAELAPPATSGDRYGAFIDQPWKATVRDPLSTFSIDVDTASYSNVRRMIQESRTIPRDAVRIEECINAFSYHYAQPKGDGPFAIGATLAVCPWAPAHQLVRVAIKGREIEPAKRPASNLVFLIDVSGSMQSPDKLPLLKQSMALLVNQLDERDRVAIVVYASTEGVALPSTRLDAEGRATVLKTLANLNAGGSTNGGAGIQRAYELALNNQIVGGVNRVILATDGDFNVGVTGQGSLVNLVKDRAKNGIYLTVLGFGTGNLNDAMMDAITRDGNGNYFYIDSEREGRRVFTKNLTGTLVTIAKDVKIQVEFNPARVANYRLIGYSNRVLRNQDFNNDKVDAGDIGAGHTVTAFYELIPPGTTTRTDDLKYQSVPIEKPASSNEWLTVKLRYKHPQGNESRKIQLTLTGEVPPLEQTDAEFQFATAAALFGMKLRSMEEVRVIGWDKVIALAQPGLANDPTEDRAEFVGLVKKLAGDRPGPLPAPAEVMPGSNPMLPDQ